MPQLPTELFGKTIQALTLPVKPLQYGYTPDVLRALLQLCLVSREFYIITTPRLYTSIYLEDAHNLSALAETLTSTSPHLARHVRDIFVKDFEDSLSPAYAKALASVLSGVSSTLRRVVFDRPIRNIWPEDDVHSIRPPLRDAFDSLHDTEELVSIQCELFLRHEDEERNVCWPRYTSLARLAFYNPLVDDEFVKCIVALPGLTHLTLANADFEGSEDLRQLLTQAPQLKRLQFISQRLAKQAFLLDGGLEAVTSVVKDVGKDIEVVCVQGCSDSATDPSEIESEELQAWIRIQVKNGVFWELDGMSLLEGNAS